MFDIITAILILNLNNVKGSTLAEKVFNRRNNRGSQQRDNRQFEDIDMASSYNQHKYNYYHHHDHPHNPSLFTEFNTAAYRFGHSQTKSFIEY